MDSPRAAGTYKAELERFVEAVNGSAKARDAAAAWPTIVQFEPEGEQTLHLIIDGGRLALREGAHIKPVIVVEGRASALIPVVRGDMDISHPIAHGELRIARGRYLDVVNLSRIALAAKRRGQ